jgi:hypothetical protein
MPLVTYYVALPFRYLADGQVAAGEPLECPDTSKARSTAATMARDSNYCGAIAFSRTGDPAIGESKTRLSSHASVRLTTRWHEVQWRRRPGYQSGERRESTHCGPSLVANEHGDRSTSKSSSDMAQWRSVAAWENILLRTGVTSCYDAKMLRH